MTEKQMITEELLEDLARFEKDPLGFVLYAFPWGEGELKNNIGPEFWQRRLLEAIRNGMPLGRVLRLATASGHGVGKSALVSWLILWAMSTKAGTQCVVTANTETQLRTKTWAQLAKWHRLCICKDLFKFTGTSLLSVDPMYSTTWRADMIPWSENNPGAFAGLHNKDNRVLIVFDEAAEIDDIIWETAMGGLTDADTQIIWAVFGNPTSNTGYFRECWGIHSHRWQTFKVDGREVSLTNKTLLNEWIEDYGLASDFVRIRVLGEFPVSSLNEFISVTSARDAAAREIYDDDGAALIFGVDVARRGDNSSVIYRRRGLDGRSLPPIILQTPDLMDLVSRVISQAQIDSPDAIFIDEGGMGAGVIDRLRQLRADVIGINFGSSPDRFNSSGQEGLYHNKRSEMWGMMREWLRNGAIPPSTGGVNDPGERLIQELASPLYGFNDKSQAIMLESKEAMRKRGISSPDIADALALTFAYPVSAKNPLYLRKNLVVSEWDPFNLEAA